jgi:(p)ppGpp synthase/HD superfamily hydrolase
MNRDFAFIKRAFVGAANYAYSVGHAWHTAQYLKKIAKKHGEVSAPEIKNIFFAALGHDLLEDTKVTAAEIKKRWGEKVLHYIKALTNEKGDRNFGPYIKRLKKSSEEILLIKFADIYSNAYNSVKNFKTLNKKWIRVFWLPLLKRYEREFFRRKFYKYTRTADVMIAEIKLKMAELKRKI